MPTPDASVWISNGFAKSGCANIGEVVKAFVVLAPGHAAGPALAAELQDHVKKAVAPYKYPRAVAFVESLPRTVSGKISRRLLRESEFFPFLPSQPVPSGA